MSEKQLETRLYPRNRSRGGGWSGYIKGSGLILSGYLLARWDLQPTFSNIASYIVSLFRILDPTTSVTNAQVFSQPNNAKPDTLVRPIGDVQWYKCPGIDDPQIECGTIVCVIRLSPNLRF